MRVYFIWLIGYLCGIAMIIFLQWLDRRLK